MPSPRRPAFPSATQAVLLYLALFLCELVVDAALRDGNRLFGLSAMQIGVLSSVLGNGLVFAVVMQQQKLGWRALFHPSSASMRATLMLVVPPTLLLVPALMLAITCAINLLTLALPLSAWEEAMFSRMADGSVAAVLAVCVMAPLLEKMLFRGIVLRGFLQRYGRGQAIFMSALLFGAAHMNIYQFVVGVAMGAVLGWLYERTRSLIPCIALHAAYNSATLLVGGWLEGASPAGVLSFVLLAGAAALCGGVVLRQLLVASGRPSEG
jgi:membrane protease YdiL (CAAX protease family)